MAIVRTTNTGWSNGTLGTSASTPTVNYNYNNPRNAVDLENSVIENGVVKYNPANWNWGYDNYIPTTQTQTTTTNQSTEPFTIADILNQRAQAYQSQWLNNLANSYKTLNNENSVWNNTANQIANYYNTLASDIASREEWLANTKSSLVNQLAQDIANQRQYVMDYFGPNGIFTNQVNQYYDDAGNYLASEAGRQIAQANAEGIQSWASLWAQRAARNQAYNNAFQNYLKVKEQELTAKMNIQTQLINYIQALREEYGNTTNAYIISQYERANDLLNTISNNLNSELTAIANARLTRQTTPSSTSSNSTTSLRDLLAGLVSQWVSPEAAVNDVTNNLSYADLVNLANWQWGNVWTNVSNTGQIW